MSCSQVICSSRKVRTLGDNLYVCVEREIWRRARIQAIRKPSVSTSHLRKKMYLFFSNYLIKFKKILILFVSLFNLFNLDLFSNSKLYFCLKIKKIILN